MWIIFIIVSHYPSFEKVAISFFTSSTPITAQQFELTIGLSTPVQSFSLFLLRETGIEFDLSYKMDNKSVSGLTVES